MAKPGVHMHGCPHCKGTFLCNCREAATTDPSCVPCVNDTGRSLHVGRLPIRCCTQESRPARKDEVILYRLAGTKPWFMCAECKRAFIYQPTENC